MHSKKSSRFTMASCLAVFILALIASATAANAQEREDRWEFSLGLPYQLSTDADFKGGSTVSTDNELGFAVMSGYNLSNRLNITFGMLWSSVGYDASILQEDSIVDISGSYDTWKVSGNAVFNFMEGPFTPFAGAGIGWAWIDTNIPNGLPTTGCWWDPWYGYVCYTDYPTASTDAFFYQALLGLRWDINQTTFLRLSYISSWMDFENADGSPRFDTVGVDVGWMF